MSESYSSPMDDETTPDEIEREVERLTNEYRLHMSHQVGKVARRKPIEEVTSEFREVLSWLQVENIELANDHSVKGSNEIYLDYSAYDIEDTYFIVYESLKGRRNVRVEDIIREHEETNLRAWQEKRTKEAASFLIIHGADENEINRWNSVEGTARQQRAMRRMYWLLSEPYMQQFKDFLRKQAETEKPFMFASLTVFVKRIINDGLNNIAIQLEDMDALVPRKREEIKETLKWLELAQNIWEHVFNKDVEDNVYKINS